MWCAYLGFNLCCVFKVVKRFTKDSSRQRAHIILKNILDRFWFKKGRSLVRLSWKNGSIVQILGNLVRFSLIFSLIFEDFIVIFPRCLSLLLIWPWCIRRGPMSYVWVTNGKNPFWGAFSCFLPISLHPVIKLFWNFIYILSSTLSNI